MAYTHFDAVSLKNGGFAIGKKGSEVVVIDGSRNVVGNTVAGAVSALTEGSTMALDCSKGDVFTVTPAHTATINATNLIAGQTVKLVITTSGSSSYTITFGTSFKSTGTLATGTADSKVFTVTFVSDGTNLNEVARTTAM